MPSASTTATYVLTGTGTSSATSAAGGAMLRWARRSSGRLSTYPSAPSGQRCQRPARVGHSRCVGVPQLIPGSTPCIFSSCAISYRAAGRPTFAK
ncbi:hypothetical protein FA95DRAFT_1562069 [Auriscalpium vulgare]|uniref:Uncharacterized protein n=1 Tax=Auriscalpium vulgare TaxID=40419 RepID=A0ACB8RKH1_9AGAM|nr:hypothetical protein FA95DRAFT_1562069 [Auriscalpium vulgare]